MRLPLLIHGKPSVLKNGECAKITLGEGDWTVSHDIIDSKVMLRVYRSVTTQNGKAEFPSEHQLNGLKTRLEGNCRVQVFVVEPGTERHISIYAESK